MCMMNTSYTIHCKMLTVDNLIFVCALDFRVVQKSLVFIVGLSSRFANSEVCTVTSAQWVYSLLVL